MSTPRIIAICNQKGGVAKTLTAINVGAELAASDHRVLLVDMDPQGHLAEGFGIISSDISDTLYNVLSSNPTKTIRDITLSLGDRLDLAPSNILLATLELELAAMVRREDRLKTALADVENDYDLIIIDCPPSLGLLTINAFSAAGEVVVPMSCDFSSLLGVSQLFESVSQMRRVLNPKLVVSAILPTRLDARARHGQEVIDRARQEFPQAFILNPPIPERVAVKNSFAAGQPLRMYEPSSPATLAYQSITKELLNHAP